MKKYYLHAITLATGLLVSIGSLQASIPNVTATLQTIDGKTIVRGTIYSHSASHHTLGAHLHVQLTDNRGALLNEVIKKLPMGSPRAEAGRNYRSTYSFISETKNVSKARPIFVAHPHAECPPQKS